MKQMYFYIPLVITSISCTNQVKQESQAAQKNSRPNIVILLADDAGLGDYSFAGNRMVQTPNIDKLAQQSTQFDRFYVCPVSAPTRAELLTGQYAYRNGVTGVTEGRERLDTQGNTLAELFHTAGYHTGIFGKWHNGAQYPYHPNAKGFDEFYGYCSGHWGNYWAPLLEHNGQMVKSTGFLSDNLTNHAMAFIKKYQDSPFLCYVPFNIPHSPMMVTDSWWNPWAKKEITQHGTLAAKEDHQNTRAALALMENLDWNVGRILQQLEELNLSDNTIVLYFSDNGPNGHRYCQGLKGIKASVDEGGVRSPLLLRYPQGEISSTHIAQLSGAVDILPTLLKLTNIDVADSIYNQLDGIDLSGHLKENQKRVSRSLLTNWGRHSAMRKDSLLLTSNGELYNTIKDPAQKQPIHSREVAQDTYRDMRATLDRYTTTIERLKKENASPYFTIGHPKEWHVKLPARDGVPHGNIRRSNKYPNSSYFTNWIDINDAITWHVDVLTDTRFKVMLHYRCEKRLLGSTISLSSTEGSESIITRVDKPFYQPMLGADLDRVSRKESYMPQFKAWDIGTISLKAGKQTLKLQATAIPHQEVMDVYMLELIKL